MSTKTLELPRKDGVAADLPGRCDEPIEARDARGEVVFRYDPATRRAVMILPGAGLSITCTDGVLELHAPRGIRLRTEGTVQVEAREGVKLEGERIEARVETAALQAASVSARASVARFAWGKLELSAGRLFEWAGAVYRRVDGLLHTRAGRIRTQSKGAALLQADTARIQAKNEVRIDGSSVHLC